MAAASARVLQPGQDATPPASGVPIAASTCYAAKKRPLSARARRDAALLIQIKRVYQESGEVYGRARSGSSCTGRAAARRGALWSG